MAILKSLKAGTPKFVRALGPDDAEGTIDGNYRYHVFNATKTGAEGFRIVTPGNGMGSDTLEYLVIAGGGGGGAQHGRRRRTGLGRRHGYYDRAHRRRRAAVARRPDPRPGPTHPGLAQALRRRIWPPPKTPGF